MRASGRTTRLVDQAIQELFTKGSTTFMDHHFGENPKQHRRACEFGFDILLKRLASEHRGVDNFDVSFVNLTVKLKSR